MYVSNNQPWFDGEKTNYNVIPKNLLPKNRNITDNRQWLRSTYQYFRCFDKSVTSNTPRNEEDLTKWGDCAVKLIEELKEIGYAEAKNEIVRIANARFELKTIDEKQIRKWTDVVTLFSDSEWFFRNVEKHRFILYYFQYGIFRSAYNNWLVDASYNWMRKYEVIYDESKNHEKKTNAKTKKGFVQELLHGKASNSIQDRFMRVTKHNLGQYILCRKKERNDEENKYIQIEEMTFMNFSAYIVIEKDHPCNVNGNNIDPIKKIEKCVNFALKKGINKAEIMRSIETILWYNGELLCL